ncbi:MAG: carbon-nitrogen hydrolase family protein [Rhodospirillales bacterium]|nr:carbon-nitrogen hydrolase family protein [Rhodospirillales bacterium]
MHVAAIQMTSGPEMQENLRQAADLTRQAAAQGATFIATPEVTDQIIAKRGEHLAAHFFQEDHPGIPFFSGLAKELGVTLLIGSMCVRANAERLANRSFLFGPDGALRVTYDKMHLFDVDLPNGESYRESDTFQAGTEVVHSHIAPEDVLLGLSICYDLRFPYLYRRLAQDGAQIIAVPAAFTVPTGKAHWHVLLRARAIETGSFLIAPAQVGDHAGIRRTYGHSLIISPRGDILAEAQEDGPCVISAELDMSQVATARREIPSLTHTRNLPLPRPQPL